ncbi:myosin heavy chain, skeletal muscle [Neodiprion pinetum]|uniref:myosin heavy chain, skeletal muscle n=1 Tax=Neodiprion pinetum TaxID=441929 RepID=UPI001EE01422|nr:trichohyalin [Neodiprion pinetum]
MGSGGSVPAASRQSTSRDLDVLCDRRESQAPIVLQNLQTAEGPTDSQGPSPYTTLRRDGFRFQGPSAPSLPVGSSVRGSYAGGHEANAPQEETLLAYASQMTGWQSGPAGSNLASTRSEMTELSRTVSCLAAANQQLATAHSAALAHLEALYRDVRSARGMRDCDKEAYAEGDEAEEERRCRGNRQRTSRWSDQGLRQAEQTATTHELETEFRKEYPTRSQLETQGRIPDMRNEGNEDEGEKTLRKALARIEELEDTLRSERLKPADSNRQRRSTIGNLVTCEKEVQCSDDEAEDVERVKSERALQVQKLNEEMQKELETQRRTIERLEEECKISTVQREKAESELQERNEELERTLTELDCSKSKRMELLREVDLYRTERDSALVRISSLEQELQKSVLDRDHAKNTEGQKSAKLRAQLAEEVADKKKQIKALEDALEEIQRLKHAVKTDRRENANLEDEADQTELGVEQTAALEENPYEASEDVAEEIACSRATNMEEFKKELTLKREARQRAIAAVSSEMDRLRRELGAEKEAHSETSRMLDLLKSGEPARDIKGLTTAEEQAEHESSASSTQDEVKRLRNQLQGEKEAHQDTLRRITAQQIADTLKVSDEIKNFVRFEAEKLEDLRYHLEHDAEKNMRQILHVKEAVGTARLVLAAREKQVNKLKDQLAHILARLEGMNYSEIFDDARAEFDHQLENLRNLKTLYEVRLKVLIEMKEQAGKELVETKEKLEVSQKKLKTLEEDLEKSEEKVDSQDTEISNLESQLGLTKADCRDLENQMSVINSLFTQMLLSASSADMDLDRLTRLLQENHDLISDMAREEGTEAAALPKLLLDLVEQVEGRTPTKPRASGSDGEKNEEDIQEGNIAHNLPKVWRVLLELLSCHAVDAPAASASALSAPDSCYKSVDTPSGPQLVISVSKTYIRLKELILEKKHLEKEMTRMKQLNTHLESKLGEQEKRLSTVSSELSKTWNIVGRMQAQHQQLHTHEKILRYELQQKRKMLQELKQELEYCREKWESARQKNTNTELEWKNLRREFAARKALAVRDSLNNSGESGFSDERGDESDEEDEERTERIRISPRRRTRKESPRVPSPDTESEQPTDTEMSESKTCSSETLEQRTPTPETETEVDGETIDVESASNEVRPATPEPDCTPETEILDPLDRALTNVIQSLIKIDTVSNQSSASTSRESIPMASTSAESKGSSVFDTVVSNEPSKRVKTPRRETREWSPHSEPWSSNITDMKLNLKRPLKTSINERSSSLDSSITATRLDEIDNCPDSTLGACASTSEDPVEDCDEKRVKNNDEESIFDSEKFLNSIETESTPHPTVSVFSIGPYLSSKSPSPVKTVQFREPLILGPRSSTPCTLNSDEASTSEQATAAATSSGTESQTNEKAETKPVEISANVSDEIKAKPELTDSQEKTLAEPANVSVSVKTTDAEDKSVGQKKETSTLEAPRPETSTASQSSVDSVTPKTSRTPEEVLVARAARLKRLEEQADWLMKKMNATSQRGSALSTRLEELHEAYGEPPAPPPLPDVLPSVRLETNSNELDERREHQVQESLTSRPEEALPLHQTEADDTAANESPPNNAP